jgi:hypothetical protein
MQQLTFIDVSAFAEGTPGKGHPFAFHSKLVDTAYLSFSNSFVFGPVQEASEVVFPIFTRRFFDRGFGNFFQKIEMKQDIERANAKLDNIPGFKVLHFFEGGLRDLTFLAELLSQRRDIVAVFNFFSLEPWQQILTSKFPGSKHVRRRLRELITELSESVAFTCDSARMQTLYAEHLELKEITVYPLFSSVRPPAKTDPDWTGRRYSFLFTPRTRSEQRLVIKALGILSSPDAQTHCVAIAPRWKANFNPKKIRKLLTIGINAEAIKGPLTHSEYGELFHQSKVVVLPYLDKHYILGSSGKVLDSRMANSITVAPLNTSAGQLVLEKGWGRAFDISPKNLALVLSEIDLEGKPEFEDADPSAEKCIQEIVDLSRNLKFAETKLGRMSFLYALPFLLGLRGTRWTFINLIAAPLLRVVKKSRKKFAK